MTKIIGLNGKPLWTPKRAELEKVKKNYEELRQIYLEENRFLVKLLSDAEGMDKIKRNVKKQSFLGWTPAHSDALQKLRDLVKYLEDNPESWDYRYVDKVIHGLPNI